MKSWKLLVLVVILFAGIGIYLFQLDPSFLYLQLAFNEQSFSNILSEWKPDGVAHYRAHFPVDFVLLVTYALFGHRYGCERAAVLFEHPRLKAYLMWSLPVAAIADATENIVHLMLTGDNAYNSGNLYLLSGSAAVTKFIFIIIFIICWIRTRKFNKNRRRTL